MSSSNEIPQNENIPLNIKNAHNLVKKVNPKEISKELEKIKQRYKYRFPYSIVWSPIPCISWIIPIIGHVGICNSEGIVYDFASPPYYVSVDDMIFGNPTKVFTLELNQKEMAEYDKIIELGKQSYDKLFYSLFINNSHSFIAKILNDLNYKGRNDYNMIDIWWIFLSRSRYISWIDLFKTYSGLIIILSLILIIYIIIKYLI